MKNKYIQTCLNLSDKEIDALKAAGFNFEEYIKRSDLGNYEAIEITIYNTPVTDQIMHLLKALK